MGNVYICGVFNQIKANNYGQARVKDRELRQTRNGIVW